ncbi:caspase family protein [Streptomyces sp. P1-3]|uniref:caspase family protein n=1 Tax=Streptomyces sp. P1-3 TaxID=3421658 RepID=UPI003D36541F
MRTVYALLVGIDDYPKQPLGGCVNDVRAAARWLRGRPDLDARVRPLHNREATRTAVLRGITDHLALSGPGDTALLWFSGHGAQAPTDDPREATGMSQALVCHDSLTPGGQPLLADTELGGLLDGIADRGAHVVAVLDCCYSGGATRGDDDGLVPRGTAWQPWWRTPGGRGAAGPGPYRPRHVLLAASRVDEEAREGKLDGLPRGLFSHALLHALGTTGPLAAYGELHDEAADRVRRTTSGQHPQLVGASDRRFLHGDPLPAAPFRLRHTIGGWQVNCGAAHGLRAPGAEFTVLASPGGGRRAGARVVVRAVEPETARVEPVGWQPGTADREAAHPVTPSALALPPTTVAVTGATGQAAQALREAIADAALLNPAPSDGDRGTPPRAQVTVEITGAEARLRHRGLDAGLSLPLRSPGDAGRIAACLTHIARWRALRDLGNPDPGLSALVRVSLEPLRGGGGISAAGEHLYAYGPDGSPPLTRVRIHNDSGRKLWCVLLNLTDSYASHTALYEGDFIGPGRAGLARGGEPVWLSLPGSRPLLPGAAVQDWLKLIVTENELNTAPFRLPAWSPEGLPGRAGSGPADAVLRFGTPGTGGRDMGGAPHGTGRWGTATAALRTVVP